MVPVRHAVPVSVVAQGEVVSAYGVVAGRADPPVVVKQYGEVRTGTNAIRTMVRENCPAALVLMHLLGDKHSPPVDLARIWAEAAEYADPATAFVGRATMAAPASSNHPGDPAQRDHLLRLAPVVAAAFAGGRLRFVISIKHPYSWMASLRRYERRSDWHTAGAFVATCRRYNANYGAWLALADGHAGRVAVARHEDLVDSPGKVLADLAARLGLVRGPEPFRSPAGIVDPSYWDHSAVRVRPGSQFDADYYRERLFLRELPRRVLDIVRSEIDWALLAPLGYSPASGF